MAIKSIDLFCCKRSVVRRFGLPGRSFHSQTQAHSLARVFGSCRIAHIGVLIMVPFPQISFLAFFAVNTVIAQQQPKAPKRLLRNARQSVQIVVSDTETTDGAHSQSEKMLFFFDRLLQENEFGMSVAMPTQAPSASISTSEPTLLVSTISDPSNAPTTSSPTSMPTQMPVIQTATPSNAAVTTTPTSSPVVEMSAAPTIMPTFQPVTTSVPTDAPVLDTSTPTNVPETAVPTEMPTVATFECGGVQSSQAIDIVIAVDESRSMENEQQRIQEHVGTLFDRIAVETNGVFRIALVGFTGPSRTNDQGSRIGPVFADPELKTALTNDQSLFQEAVANLTINKRDRENTRGTLLAIAQNQIQDVTGTVVPLAGEEQFPSNQGFCAFVITDEGNQAYNDFPDPGNQAVLDEFAKTDSVVFMVAPISANGLRQLALDTGGFYSRTGAFVDDPGPLIENVVNTCVSKLCNETAAPTMSPGTS